MKKAEVQRLVKKYLLPDLDHFVLLGPRLVASPVQQVLRAFDFQPSGFESGGFYVWVFVQPLYIPQNSIILTFGDRLGGASKFWRPTGDQEATVMREVLGTMRADGIPFLNRIHTPEAFGDWRQGMPGKMSLNEMEAVAYSWILGRRHDDVREMFRAIDTSIPEAKRQHMRLSLSGKSLDDLVNRIETVRRQFETDPEAAVAQLIAWRNYTVQQLKLQDFAQTAVSSGQNPFSR